MIEINKEYLIKVYELLIDTNNTVFSINHELVNDIFTKRLNKNDLIKLRNSVYEIYDKEYITGICRKKQAKYRNSKRINIRRTDEQKENSRKSAKLYWKTIKESGNDTRTEISRKSMLKTNSLGRHLTTNANLKRISTRKNNNEVWHTSDTKQKISKSQLGKIVSNDTKKNISKAKRGSAAWNKDKHGYRTAESLKKSSDITRYLHHIGTYPFKRKSKAHSEIENIIQSLEIEFKSEYKISKYSYDIYVESKNLVIEYNGTYWHLDPAVYPVDYYDKSKNRYAIDQWNRDDIKRNTAVLNGYAFITIWQREWDSLNETQKILKIKKILNVK